ncbi:MAG TPA: CRISPR system precrRNA processing endoribonuclease RAMP protein Cas6 [Syntrophobacteraceae bacterium]|nr:CRISPR system precrRNA processing endoribonuclease RAMP protein Cas6 [Syntrophobacteraceae bacterium]
MQTGNLLASAEAGSASLPEQGRKLSESLGSFRCLRLQVEVRARNRVALPPYRGSTLRGAFGLALLRSACVLRQQKCPTCLLRRKCIYSYTFETPLWGENGELRRYAAAPHPFVLTLEVGREEVHEAGSEFEFAVTLVGRAVDFLPYYVHAFQRMGETGIGKGRGRFEVLRVLEMDVGDEIAGPVYEGGVLRVPRTVLGLEDALAVAGELSGDGVTLDLLTPLRLVYGGELCREPAFHVLVRNLLRRLHNLTLFHCDDGAPPPDGALIDLAEQVVPDRRDIRWHDWERYSHRQERRMKLGGLLGKISYRGDLAPFLPLLVLGSWVNLGKNTSFGLGRYRVKGADRK